MDGVFPSAAMLLRRRLRGGRIAWRLTCVVAFLAAGSVISSTAFAQSGPREANPFDTAASEPRPSATVPTLGEKPFDIAEENPLLQPLVDVRVEGNATIAQYVILKSVTTRPGRPASQAQITEDVRALYDTRWFVSVNPVYQQTDEGLVLVFRVVEKPVVRSVTFTGNTWHGFKTKRLEAETGLKPGAPFDVTINQEAAQRIRELYIEKGYRHVTVTLAKGDDPADRDVVFVIKEGPKVQVRDVRVEGNRFTSDAVLELNKETKTRWLPPLQFVGGKYDPETIPNDEIALTQYYQGLGFFDVEVSSEVNWASEEKSLVDVIFRVKEGCRYRVRNVVIAGEQVVPERKLRQELKLVKGEFFNARFLANDVTSMKTNYDELGRLFAVVDAKPIFLEQPGAIDLEYHIDEDKVYYIGDINVNIRGDHPHTSEDVIRSQVDAFIQPGRLANATNIRKMQSRLIGSHLWERQDPPSVNLRKVEGSNYLAIDIVGRAQSSERADAGNLSTMQRPLTTRDFGEGPRLMNAEQSGDTLPGFSAGGHSHDSNSSPAQPQAAAGRRSTDSFVSLKPTNFGHSVSADGSREASKKDASPEAKDNLTQAWQRFQQQRPNSSELPTTSSPVETSWQADQNEHDSSESVSMWEISPPALVIRAQSDEVFRAQSSNVRGQSMDSFGNPVPQNYLQGVSPQGDPYGNGLRGPLGPGFVDVDIDVTEARTGRLMFGLGVNSDAGVVGNIVLEENNFDISRPPTSFADILNGQAWRGGGQSFRIEAVPGSEVSRYLVSWQDPFFMNTDFSFGVSGFYYTRFFEDWDEQRLGGRITLGRLLGNFWSASGALRLENVDIQDVRMGAPPILQSVAGVNFLSTARVALAHDTRDSSFLPTQGHFVEASYEQGFGEFNYPRAEITGSQFFTLYERPDGRGKHILQLRGQVGWTGDDTPIFERFYAGGFQSFRGFEFRGVTPRIGSTKVGGQFMLLGTAEYIVPITASDNVRGVVFSDFGTVEESAGIDQFRASVGAGLRLIVPAMGPAPIALDFAVPLTKQNFDEEQLFSFYVGFTR